MMLPSWTQLLMLQLLAHASIAGAAWSWSTIQTFCFPGGFHPAGNAACNASYSADDLANYRRFDLVLVQGQNYTKYSNGSWRATQQAESASFATSLNRTVFPYLAFYAPQAWYEAQSRFNDPEPHWEDMWLRDSHGVYSSMTHSPSSALCSTSTEEHGDFTQYKWRRLYDWRRPAARKFMTEQVIDFILEDPHLGGAFFDDVNSVASIDIQCGCPNCKCECGNWTIADRVDFVNASLGAVEQVLTAFAKHQKQAILSLVRTLAIQRGFTNV